MVTYQWADIPEFEGRYQVSKEGSVRSLVTNRVMKLQKHNQGYSTVALTLRDGSGRKKQFLVHRLVAEAFIANTENRETVNHRNGDKRDNSVDNLEWATYSENIAHSYKQLGRTAHTATLRDSSRPCVCLKDGEVVGVFPSATTAATVMGLRNRGVSRAATGERKTYASYGWKYL